MLVIAGAVAGVANAQYLQSDNLMPSPHYHGDHPVGFLLPAVQMNSLDFDVTNGRLAPPAPGASEVSSFFDVFTEISLDSGAGPHISRTRMTGQMHITDSGGGTYQTEMLQMDIRGGELPAGTMIRESPTKQSLGRTTLAPVANGYIIDSFFDVFTELSIDNGQTWSPATDSMRMTGSGTPEPASVLAIFAGVTGLLLRRKKK